MGTVGEGVVRRRFAISWNRVFATLLFAWWVWAALQGASLIVLLLAVAIAAIELMEKKG